MDHFLFINMKRFVLASVVLLLSLDAFSQENTANFKWYGFIRNFFAYDSREMVSGTEDFFTYLPKDIKMDPTGTTDLNDISSFRFAALTSRLGVDVSGYAIEGWKVGAKIEADFYSGVSGVTGTAQFRLRQAYLTMAKNDWTLKAGQAWHPFAADIPDVFSLNAGAPFTPFNRTPLVQVNHKVNDKFSYDFAVIWQMQYTSAGPNGQKADYIKYAKTPELNAGVTYKSGAFTAKAGYNFLSIKPRNFNAAGTAKVDDRISTSAAYVFAQYVKGDLSVKAKATFAEAGEHMNLNGGYAVTSMKNDTWEYTPTRNLSSWVSLKYGKKLQGIFFAGFAKNYGTKEEIVSPEFIYFSKNSFSNMNAMYRVTPSVVYNLGKVSFGLEYELTSVQYGKWDMFSDDYKYGLATGDLHWVTNNRVQALLRYTF